MSLLPIWIAIICLVPLCSGSRVIKSPPLELKYHKGPLLEGHLTLSLLWYGTFEPVEKKVVRSFIKSIGSNGSPSLIPDASSWWKMVESYLAHANANAMKVSTSSSGKKVSVRIEREVDDHASQLGHDFTMKNLPVFLKKAKAKGPPVNISVVIVSKEIDAVDMCKSSCYLHGVHDKEVYIVVHNPEKECPGKCAIPFHQSDIQVGPPVPLAFQPPSGNMGADAILINFASALAETVTNPFNNGFYAQKPGEKAFTGAVKACFGLFAKGGFPGYPGNVRIDPVDGGCFNTHGVNGSKFLLPALWDPKTSSCWTPL